MEKVEYWVHSRKSFEIVIVKQEQLPLLHNRRNQLWVIKYKSKTKQNKASRTAADKDVDYVLQVFFCLLIKKCSGVT